MTDGVIFLMVRSHRLSAADERTEGDEPDQELRNEHAHDFTPSSREHDPPDLPNPGPEANRVSFAHAVEGLLITLSSFIVPSGKNSPADLRPR